MKKLLFCMCVLGLTVSNAFSGSRLTRKECVTRVETCEAIIREFQANPATAIPASVLARATAIVITNQFKAGFILGVKDGYGVLLLKKVDGQWSVPGLINAGEASVGLQVGGNAIETIYVFMDPRTPRLLFSQRLNVGADAEAVAGPRAADAESTTEEFRKHPVLVYTKARGLFAGASVKTGFLSRDDAANRLLYETTYGTPEIVDSDWITPPSEARPLMDYIRSITK
ncbi:MAG: lipid-binding SYLF domain-containing protein [Opitutaceae bacterium]|nr:lipid-binding SYLF domain-containing protein [Opitutaceae bacterium]